MGYNYAIVFCRPRIKYYICLQNIVVLSIICGIRQYSVHGIYLISSQAYT